MTNTITNATHLTAREATDLAHTGARDGRPSATALGNLGSSFHSMLDKGARIDAQAIKASMGLAHSGTQDWMSPSAPDSSSWRRSDPDDANASDGHTADEYDEWNTVDRERKDQTQDASTAERTDSAADAVSRADRGDEDEPAILDLPLAGAGGQSSRTATAADPGAGTAGDAADPMAPPSKGQETTQPSTNSAQRADAHAVSKPAHDAPDVSSAAAARQADELAKSLPAGKDVKLHVTVSKPGDTLFSQPVSALAAATAANGQKSGSQPGQPAVGASAIAAAARSNAQANAQASTQASAEPGTGTGTGIGIGRPQLQAITDANPSSLAAAQPRTAGTPAPAPAGFLPDVAGTLSSVAPQAAPRGTPAPVPAQNPSAPPQPPVAEQVSVQISKAVKAGVDRIDIQLRPKELGRVDVRLELAGDGRVSASVTVDNRETLEMLKTDARGLERALDDAGLKADSNSLSFNLRGHDRGQSGNSLAHAPQTVGRDDNGQGEIDDGDAGRALGDYARGGVSADGRVDIEI